MAETRTPEGPRKYPQWDARQDGSSAPGSFPGWPKGMNNVQASESLPKEFLRSAVNVEVDDVGKVKLRTGSALSVAAPTGRMHSGWAWKDISLVVDGSTLYRVEADGTLTALMGGLTLDAKMVYLELNGEIYFTNGLDTGVISNGAVRRWGVPVPTAPAPGVSAGALLGGRYTFSFTFNTTREEGGCSRSALIDAADGSSFVVTMPTPFPPEVVSANLYVSAPDGSVEYLYGTYSTPGLVVTINALTLSGRECSTKFLTPPPAGSMLMYYRGRIYIAADKVVYHTEPLRYGAVKLAQNFLMFPAKVRMLAATKEQDGFFVSDDNEHYFIEGAHEESKQNFCAPYPAIPGTFVRDELTDEPVWFTTKGWVKGKAGGQLEALMALTVAVPEYESGAALYREEDGLRQYISSFPPAPEENRFSATDYIEAEVIRKGA